MSSSRIQHVALTPRPAPGFRSERRADRLMRRLFGITGVDRRSGEGAHRAFRIAVVVSGAGCLLTYLDIQVLVVMLSLSGWFAVPEGVAQSVRHFVICI